MPKSLMEPILRPYRVCRACPAAEGRPDTPRPPTLHLDVRGGTGFARCHVSYARRAGRRPSKQHSRATAPPRKEGTCGCEINCHVAVNLTRRVQHRRTASETDAGGQFGLAAAGVFAVEVLEAHAGWIAPPAPRARRRSHARGDSRTAREAVAELFCAMASHPCDRGRSGIQIGTDEGRATPRHQVARKCQ